MQYYITEIDKLNAELERREYFRDEIRDRVDGFASSMYGIDSFSDIVRELGPKTNSRPLGMLARQIPHVNVEGISISVLCQLLGLDFLAASFEDDTFSLSSLDKVPPLAPNTFFRRLKRNRKEVSMTNRREVYSGVLPHELDGVVIKDIPRFYPSEPVIRSRSAELKRMTLAENWDVSSFWRVCMKAARNKPEFVYVATTHERGEDFPRRAVKVAYTDEVEKAGENLALRPPAKWYYPLYFCLYLTGEIVLLETYSNPRGQVAEAEKLFMRTMQMIESSTGEVPMVVQTLPLSEEMLYVNADITPVALADILRLCALGKSSQNIPSLHDSIAKQVLGYCSLKKWHNFFDFGLGKLSLAVNSNT